MAMTATVKDELSRVAVSKVSARKAEVSALLRFAGGLHIVAGRVIVDKTVRLPVGCGALEPIQTRAARTNLRREEVAMRVQELLRNKGFQVITVQPAMPVTEAVALLKEHNLGAVVVSVDGRQVNGILTERDVVRRLVEGTEFLQGPASDIMTADVLTCAAADSGESVMSTMTQQRIRHLPVVDEHGRLTGIVSIGDVVKSHITQVEFERDMLEGYVSG